MTLKISTGLRNAMLDTESLRDALDLGFVKVYSGTEPSDADAAIGGGNTLLCTYSVSGGGTGLTLEAAAASGVITKETTETWQGACVASGTASFYRHVAPGDTGALSTTEARIQGTCGLAGTGMVLSSLTFTLSATKTLPSYSIALPAS